MLDTVHRSKGLTHFRAFCDTQYTDAPLAGLGRTTQLSCVVVQIARTLTLHTLSALKCLKLCVLCRPAPDRLDLSALRQLPNLESLWLEGGTFDCFPASLPLKRLNSKRTYITAAFQGMFALTLESLAICTCQFRKLHANSPSACSNLQTVVGCHHRGFKRVT